MGGEGSRRGLTRRASRVSLGLSLALGACTPFDPLEDVELAGPAPCKRNLDCAAGEICNPGALRCVQDVTVADGELAGTAWYVLGEGPSGVRSGQTKNVYVKARFGGQEIIFDNIFAQELLGRWFVNLGQSTGSGRFSMAFNIALPPAGPGVIELHDDVDFRRSGGTAVLGGHDEAFLFREYVAVTHAGAITVEEYPDPLEPLEQVRLSFSAKLEDIGPAAYLIYSTTCGVDEEGRALGLYDGVDDVCHGDFAGQHFFAGLDCLFGERLPEDGGNAALSWTRPPGNGAWLDGAPSALNREGKCQAGVHDTGEILIGAYASIGDEAPGRLMYVEILARPEQLTEGALIELKDLDARLFQLTVTQGGVDARPLGRLGSGALRVHRFARAGERPRLYVSLRGAIGGHLTEGALCDRSNDECGAGLRCQPGSTGETWCMKPCSREQPCDDGRTCLQDDAIGPEYAFCGNLYSEFQSGCSAEPRRHELCAGALRCTDYEGSRVCLTACDRNNPQSCGPGRICGTGGYCLSQPATYEQCGGAYQQCEAGDQCQRLYTPATEVLRCLQLCAGTPCPEGESCYPSDDPAISHCFRDIPQFGACGEAQFLSGRQCATGMTCLGDLELCTRPCTGQCAGGQICRANFCFRPLARYASCDESALRRGYVCALADLCVTRTDLSGQPSLCYADCSPGRPACPAGTTCTTLSNGSRACLR